MKRILRYMMTGLVAVALTMTAVATPAARADDSSSEDGGCGDLGHWPADVQGVPEGLRAGAAAGIYVWHDADGWHLVATHPGHERSVFTGRIVTDGDIFGIGRRIEGPDKVSVTSGHRLLGYRFTNFGYIDGVAFRTRCGEHIGISGSIDGHPLTPEQVFIGRDGHHPDAVPFGLVRV